ncbi:MAG TPA: hypothetical protein VH598_07675 [Verrucomicrobiae bacterium]|nr:hypothetical protein [Verrucomicrobiae bacterium]
MNKRQILTLILTVGLAPLAGWSAAPATTDTPAQPQTVATDSGARLSAPTKEVLKMASKGVPEDVLKAYIDNSSSTFNLTSDAIIYLQGQCVSGPVTSEMLSHDKALFQKASAYPPAVQAPLTPPVTAPYPYPATDVTQPDYSYATPPVNYVYNEGYPGGYWYYAPAYGGWCWYPFVGFGFGGFGFHRFHDFDRFHHFDRFHDFDRFHHFENFNHFNHFNGGVPFHHQFAANRGFTPVAHSGFTGLRAGGGAHFGGGFHGGGGAHFGGGGFHGGGGGGFHR